jgi:hypothetical protein
MFEPPGQFATVHCAPTELLAKLDAPITKQATNHKPQRVFIASPKNRRGGCHFLVRSSR